MSIFILSPLLLGSNRDWSIITITTMSLVGALITAYFKKISFRWIYKSAPGQLLLFCLLATAFQLIPLPISIIEAISPETFKIASMALGNELKYTTLSLEVPHTQLELIKLFGYLFTLIMVSNLRFRQGSQKTIKSVCYALAVSGLVVGLLGVTQGFLGLTVPFGMDGLSENDTFTSTFINPNHLAAFLGIAVFASIRNHQEGAQGNNNAWVWLLNAAFLSICLFLTLSRGAIIAFLIALFIFMVAMSIAHLHRNNRPIHILGLLGTIATTITLLFLTQRKELYRELSSVFETNAFSKTQIWSSFPDIINAFPLFGIGRGAFISVFPRYSPVTQNATFTHYENEYLQLFVDWGLIAGLLISLLLIKIGIQIIRNQRKTPVNWALIAIPLFLGIHNVVDFNMTFMSIANPLLIILFLLVPAPNSSSTTKTQKQLLIISALGIAFTAIAGQSFGHELISDTKMVVKTLASNSSTGEEKRKIIDQAITRHPADYILHLQRASSWDKSSLSAVKSSLPSINKALFMAPNRPEPHQAAGDALFRLGARNQAFTEYRIALRTAPYLLQPIVNEIIRISGRQEDLIKLAGYDLESIENISQVLLARREFKLALRVLANHLEDAFGVLERRGIAYKSLKDWENLKTIAQRIQRNFPENIRGYIWESQANFAKGEAAQALDSLDKGLTKLIDNQSILIQKAILEVKLNRFNKAKRSIKIIQSQYPLPIIEAQCYALLGHIAEQNKNRTRALELYKKAYQTYPMEFSYLESIVNIRIEMGDKEGAFKLLKKSIMKSQHVKMARERLKTLDLKR